MKLLKLKLRLLNPSSGCFLLSTLNSKKMLGRSHQISYVTYSLSTFFSLWSCLFSFVFWFGGCFLVCFCCFSNWLNNGDFRDNFLRSLVAQVLIPTAVRKGFFQLRRYCLFLLLPKWRHSSMSSSPTRFWGRPQMRKGRGLALKYFSHVMMDEDLPNTNFFLLYLLPALWP